MKVFTTLMLMFSHLALNCQIKEADVMQLKEKISPEIFKNAAGSLKNDPTARIEYLPTIHISHYSLKNGDAIEFDSSTIDTALGSSILYKNNSPAIFAFKQYDSHWQYEYYGDITLRVETNVTEKEIGLITFALKYSKNPFFVYFFTDERWQNTLIGFFKNDTLCFINSGFKIYTNTGEMIDERYGSKEKFIEMGKSEVEKNKFRSTLTLKNAIDIYKKSYINWENAFPKDTVKILDLFINEMDSLVHLSNSQKKLLVNKILKTFKSLRLNCCGFMDVCLLGEPIDWEISEVLTKEQYYSYLDKRKFDQWAVHESSDIIFIYLAQIKKVSSRDLKKAFENFVYKAK